MIKYIKDIENIVTLTLAMKESDKNIINYDLASAFLPVIKQLRKEKKAKALRGVIITSDKANFLSGGEPTYLYKDNDAKSIFDHVEQLKGIYRKFERLAVPVVAAINGDAKGPGFEFILGCHHRIALNQPDIRIGLVHTRYGLIPGSGGTIRLLWMMGIEKAYPILVDGKLYSPVEANEAGLVDQIAESEEEMLYKARTFIRENDHINQPWDAENAKIPRGTLKTLRNANFVTATSASLIRDTYNKYPAKQAILNTIVEACAVDFDTALRVESRNFTSIVLDSTSRNMVNAFWKDTNYIEQGNNKPKGFELFKPKKVAVIGAGYMGSGIALDCAVNGLEVILKDVSLAIANRGMEFCKAGIERLVEKGRISEKEKHSYLEKITATEDPADFADCDVIIESVYENSELKHQVNQEAEAHMKDNTLYASNTSSLSVADLCSLSRNKDNFIGIRFFAPVPETRIVEVIQGECSTDASIAKAFDFVRMLHKLPIVVQDINGFFTSRIKIKYVEEGLLLLQEGNNPATIEHSARFMGLPSGPLEEADLLMKFYIDKVEDDKAKEVLDKLYHTFERKGKIEGKGFYNYENENKLHLWKQLPEEFPYKGSIGTEDIQKRLVFVQIIEALKCYDEGIINSIEEVNIATIYGDSFAPFKGGMFQYLVDYGEEQFRADVALMQDRYGDRFALNGLLDKASKTKEIFA